MEKTMKARVQHKHDLESNWLKATNFTPLVGEIIVYDPDENYDYPRIKIGDGETNINALPFVTKEYAKISDIPTKPEDIGALPDSTVIPTVPTKISAFENDKGYITSYTETDPTVPAWAKADTKPTYTASEVGALPSTTKIPGALSDLSEDTTHRVVTDVEKEAWNAKSNFSGNYADLNGKPTIPTVPTKISAFENDVKYLTTFTETDPTVPDWAKAKEKPIYTADEVGALPDTYVPPDQTAAQVGADPAGTAAAAVSAHNTSTDSHGDLRLELKAINDRLTAFFDSDNQTLDELSEIVAYITSNKALIDSITTSKVSVADIINNLTTNVANKPLSAAQGVVLKGLIDAVSSSLSNYQPKGDYALRSELPTVPTKVSQLQNDKGYLTEHQDISGKLDADKLPEAVNNALAQAKESGEFHGEKGDPGVTPHIGTNGNWYIGSADTGVKAQGKDGAAGRGIKSIARTSGNGAAGTTDTYTITYTDNTTSTLTVYNGKNGTNGTNGTSVTVKSVSESTADGGSNVVTFSDGNTLNVKNGSKGNKGDPGTTPQKGIDFWTDADQEAIVQQVITALGTPVFGTVDADNNIILTGELANGTYTIKYEDADGNVTEIGTLNNNPGPTYTNVLPLAKGEDGNPYNGTGYAVGKRINSSWNETDVSTPTATNPVFLTGRIPIPAGATVRFKNCYIDTNGVNGTVNDAVDKAYYGHGLSGLYGCMLYYNPTSGTGNKAGTNYTWNNFVSYSNLVSAPAVDSNGYVTEFTFNTTETMYARFVLGGDPTTAIITINEPVTD